ncbi:DNA translocase FtsK [Psychrobacillus sp. INOP01]|uniref:DNA translocase FtsK n=1 Tax=Psychrobacillus sp. INOP01 TaxID=2829187 RepID=UPI001BA89980|nr:DNA translocase FtsK [Psychrobacillus sp. INOP01]QUG42403.1 DNA translocase FtsK [Psychrobacillus sp. INOP01]
MNWLKKLFASEEKEYEEEFNEQQQIVHSATKKTPFRFPLISDEEKNEAVYGYPKEEKIVETYKQEPYFKEPEYKPLHTQNIWQQRAQPTVIHRAAEKKIVEGKKVVDTPGINRKKRAFTPTEVPSPIYGFSKTVVDNKVKEKEILVDREQKTKTVSSEVLFNPEPIIPVQEMVEEVNHVIEVSEVVQDDVQVTELVEVVQAEVAVTKAQETIEPVPNEVEEVREFEVVQDDVQVTELVEVVQAEVAVTKAQETIEPVPNEVEEVREFEVVQDDLQVTELVEVVQAEVAETKVQETIEPIHNTEILETEKPVKENIRPFNVLMLKSDKSKMNRIDIMNKISPVAKKAVTITTPSTQQEQKEMTERVQVSEQEIEQILVEEQEEIQTNYVRPSFSHLLPPEMNVEDREWMEEQAFTLVDALSHFQVTGEIVQMVQGPAVTQFEITVGQGTKVSKIRNLADDLKLALAAKDIRIQAPIPGKRSIGIEIPNRTSRAVRLSEVINTDTFLHSESPLEAALGLDLTGKPVTLDLRKMPHGLIAGATGSGKSVFINSLLVSLLYKATPDEVKLLLIDPKMVELAPFNHIPHLVSPVITDVKAATAALKWAVEEMERRYQLFAHIGVRDITRYNTLATEKRQFAQKLPYIVIVIDELADLMMMAPTEVEDAICRIAQKARACGIHLVLATQRPSVDVITGLIKANIPTRIAFSVSSQIDSRTILDQQGAERLLGKGDMLYQGNGMSSPVRIQGTYVSDDEIESVIEYARGQGNPDYMFVQEELLQKEITSEQDDLFEEACRFIVEQGTASTSLLQRKFHLGYNRAARLIDAMYENGYITEQKGSKARDVLLTSDTLDEIFS